jgi:prepilin-type N-terminal cleavage/methylation domain-containing protein
MKYHKSSKNKGFTLVELVVSMGIFATIVTLAMAAFLNIVQTKSATSRLKNTQYKARIMTEIVNRMARDADRVTTSRIGGNFVEFHYGGGEPYAYRIDLTYDQNLLIRQCQTVVKLGECSNWINHISLIGDNYKVENVSFTKIGALDSILEFKFSIATKTGGVLSDFFSDEITVETSSVLENIK